MAHVLPEDLTVVLLSEWLKVGLIALSQLDVAWCNHSTRSNWLQVLTQIRTSGYEEHIRTPIGILAIWLQSRNVNISHLQIQLDDLQTLDEDSFPHFVLRSVSLTLLGTTTPAKLWQLLSWFPQLTALNCGPAMLTDDYLLEMCRHLHCDLRELMFGNPCSPAAIAQVISSLALNLEVFHCHRATCDMVRSCRKLQQICWDVADMEPEELITIISNNPHLIWSRIDAGAITEDVFAQFLLLCPNLELFISDKYLRDLDLSFTFLKPLANPHCGRSLKLFRLFPFVLQFTPYSVNGGKMCDVYMECPWPRESATNSLLLHLTLPLRSVRERCE